jgi:hypothetical protein
MADNKISQVKYKRNDITAEFVRSVLDYNPETGVFVWKKRNNLPPRANGWNTKYAGTVAGRKKISTSYLELAINGRFYSLHRLAWLYMTGEWPKHEIDHIDANIINNPIESKFAFINLLSRRPYIYTLYYTHYIL